MRLRDQRGEGTYDVLYLTTGHEPNGHDINELHNSSVPLSFKIPAADLDVDDLTLGEMLTEARGTTLPIRLLHGALVILVL